MVAVSLIQFLRSLTVSMNGGALLGRRHSHISLNTSRRIMFSEGIHMKLCSMLGRSSLFQPLIYSDVKVCASHAHGGLCSTPLACGEGTNLVWLSHWCPGTLYSSSKVLKSGLCIETNHLCSWNVPSCFIEPVSMCEMMSRIR